MGLEIRDLEIERGFGYDNGRGAEWYAEFGGADPVDHDFVVRIHVCR